LLENAGEAVDLPQERRVGRPPVYGWFDVVQCTGWSLEVVIKVNFRPEVIISRPQLDREIKEELVGRIEPKA
jgi:hypothetical protein